MSSIPISTVYGTLRRGGRLHGLLAANFEQGDVKFVADVITKPVYSMYSVDAYGSFPVLKEGGKTAIVGEVYEVSFPMLIALDGLESAYTRKPVKLVGVPGAEIYIYRHDVTVDRFIESGDWARAYMAVLP